MSSSLTNDEIRKKLLKLNCACGPVTDTTREVHLKKLATLENNSKENRKDLTDEELRTELISLGESVGPITRISRPVYLRRLEKLKKEKRNCGAKATAEENLDDEYEWEPMEID